MNRRRFLGLTVAGAAGMLLDPERLLWVPGKKYVFLAQPKVKGVTIAQLVAVTFDQVVKEQRKAGRLWSDVNIHEIADASYDGIVRL